MTLLRLRVILYGLADRGSVGRPSLGFSIGWRVPVSTLGTEYDEARVREVRVGTDQACLMKEIITGHFPYGTGQGRGILRLQDVYGIWRILLYSLHRLVQERLYEGPVPRV